MRRTCRTSTNPLQIRSCADLSNTEEAPLQWHWLSAINLPFCHAKHACGGSSEPVRALSTRSCSCTMAALNDIWLWVKPKMFDPTLILRFCPANYVLDASLRRRRIAYQIHTWHSISLESSLNPNCKQGDIFLLGQDLDLWHLRHIDSGVGDHFL